MESRPDLAPHEAAHLAVVRQLAPQCMVLLRSDGTFPLSAPGTVALYGSGARRTLKGGTGSGDVNSRHVSTIEEAMTAAGFTITTTEWLDAYDALHARVREEFLDRLRTEAAQEGVPAVIHGMGAVMPEPEHDLPLSGEGEAAVYVLSRVSGEGNDRSAQPGDVLLTDAEVRDILELDARFERFLLVLNVGGVVDLGPVAHVRNILLLSQLGAPVGEAFTDVLLGRAYPSGRLSTTWAPWDSYGAVGEFGHPDDTRYTEGVYVGYRYFDSVGAHPLFPFGHGLGYTTFALGAAEVALDGSALTVRTEVTNTGARPGREVVQVYVSVPAGRLDQPFQVLAGFAKTDELAPGASQELAVAVDLADLASFDAASGQTVLEAGDYLVRLGTSSRDTDPVAVLELDERAVVRVVHDALGDPGFTDWMPTSPVAVEVPDDLPRLRLDPGCLRRRDDGEAVELSEELFFVAELSDEELSYLVLGDYRTGGESQSIVGAASQTVVGAAGQTTTRVPGLASLIMADGPAGLRLAAEYGVDDDGAFPLGPSVPADFLELWDEEASEVLGDIIGADSQDRAPTSIHHQWATAIPIGTAIAQSWNPDLAERLGELVGAEMEHFGVHLWLAPAFNLHRSILCGRNFEYLSEDPLLAGRLAAAITRGVQSRPGRGVTIKHVAANNQETNRLNSNSLVSGRALRDLYLRGFEIVVREAGPHALMTSYNLINGVHASESHDLNEVVLRQEWGYQGLIMTDWVVHGMARHDLTHPPATAAPTVKAGNELFMPGSEADRQGVLAALDGQGETVLTRAELELQAARVVRAVWRLAGR